MTTFEDNTAVTLADLNNIAIDLGDTTFSAFSDEKFGVDKLNEITADLVGKGVLTTGDRCEPILSDGKVYIKSGVIVFGSGAKIRIESSVEVTATAGDYIYAYNDVITGKASIICSEEEPDADDDKVVVVAQVDDIGGLTDKRTLSVAKALSTADFSVQTFSQTAIVDTRIDTNGDGDFLHVSGEIELGTTLLKRLTGFRVPNLKQPNYHPNKDINCFYDFTNTKTHTIYVSDLVYGQTKSKYIFELSGSVLKWKLLDVVNLGNKNGDEFVMEVDMI